MKILMSAETWATELEISKVFFAIQAQDKKRLKIEPFVASGSGSKYSYITLKNKSWLMA